MDDAFAEEPPDADNSHNQHADEPDAPQEEEGSLEERVVSVEVGPLWDHNHATKVAREYELAHPSRRWTGQWKTIVPRQMSVINIVISSDTTKLQEAIQSEGVESVGDLLKGMSIPQQKAQLCAYYGGSKDVPGSPDNNDLHVRTSPMLHAARCGNSEAFSSLFSFTQELLKPQLKAKLKATDGIGRTVLAMAASSGKRGAFDAILAAVNNELDPTEVSTLIKAKDSENRSLLAFAAESRDEDTFKAVQEYLERELTEEEEYDLIDPGEYLGNKLLLEAVKAYKGNDLGLLNAVLKAVGNYFRPDSSHGEMLEQNRELCGQALLCHAIRCCEIELFRRTPDFLDNHLADKKAAEEITIIVSDWANSFRMEHALFPMDEYAEKIEEFFKTLLRSNKLFDWIKTCLSGPLVSSKNPFIPGLTLSLAFSRAARSAPEGEGKNILCLQEAVNEFLLQVLARLPRSVRGCKGSMSCFLLFEPALPEGRPNPLQMMLGKRKERLIFCESSLVMDYLSLRFWRGLPDLLDTNGILGDREVLGNLAKTNGGLLLDDIALEESPVAFPGNHQMLLHLRQPLVLLQGADANFPSLAGLPIVGRCPGLQFITAGIVARPSQYYRVPVLRMALEFVVYVAMVTVFVFYVIIYSEGELKQAEITFFVSFVAAGIIREVREMLGDHETYFEDDWNTLDVLSLVVLLAGFVVRSIDDTSPWGRALYALSAPLLFSRFLFFLQILQFQGPMIQVIISMIRELIQFGVVMLVVMLGFVVAFFTLVQDEETFSEVFLRLFRAMLGNDDLFDDFGDQIQDQVATALLIVYLITMTIMFLNLLIAVLSTAYSRVEENAETEYKVVKARVIQHYEMTVETESLPAPFNLVQLVLSWLFVFTGGSSHNAERIFGQAVFWLVLGPIAVAVGVLMWVLSIFHAPSGWTEYYLSQSESRSALFSCRRIAFMFIQWVIIIIWCGLLAPICLVVMWFGAPLWSGMRWLCYCCGRGQESPLSYETVGSTGFLPDVGVPGSFDINETLLNTGESARDLFTYLADPMSDPEVREGENNKLTTVEHLKRLRDRIENEATKQAEELRAVRREMKQRKKETEQKLDEIMCILRKVEHTSSG